MTTAQRRPPSARACPRPLPQGDADGGADSRQPDRPLHTAGILPQPPPAVSACATHALGLKTSGRAQVEPRASAPLQGTGARLALQRCAGARLAALSGSFEGCLCQLVQRLSLSSAPGCTGRSPRG